MKPSTGNSMAPPAAGRRSVKPSLGTRLARHVVLPLVLTWALGTAVALSVSSYFVAQAFDRSLLDDAYAVAAHVQLDHGVLGLSLSPVEMSTLLFDQRESEYFAVFDRDGRLIAGHGALRAPALPEGSAYGFADIRLRGRDLRAVSLRRTHPAAFTVVTALTNNSRNELLDRLLTYSAAPQLLLLGLLVWWLRQAIRRDLLPLARLQDAVNRRDANDLTPIANATASGTSTREVEHLGSAINSLLARLDSSVAAQREFAGNVAHELRTPLAGIRAQAEFALAHPDPAVWREQLQGIVRSEARASHQVDQLLALARADEARTSLKLGVVALDAIVRDVLLRFMPRADAAGVDLGAVGLETPARVWADAALIEGLLGNLLDNALRYGTAPEPRVTVALTPQSGGIALSVTDNGPGVSAEEASSLTGRGVQGAAGQQLGQGAGLGLAIVQRYAELLGADFSIGNVPHGTGLQATVVLRPANLPAT
jgi:two-component system sensor histidine kinase TctE